MIEAAQLQVAAWRADPESGARELAAAAVEAVLPALLEHLETEEREIVPLIDRHLSAKEWASVAGGGQRDLSPHDILLIFGMAMDAATKRARQLRARACGAQAAPRGVAALANTPV